MSTTAEGMNAAQMDEWLNKKLDEVLPGKIKEIEEARTPSMAIIATKGTLDWAYPSFILGSTAAAMGWDTTLFFTFYGLALLKKDSDQEWVMINNFLSSDKQMARKFAYTRIDEKADPNNRPLLQPG